MKKNNSSLNLWISTVVAVLALLFFAYRTRSSDKQVHEVKSPSPVTSAPTRPEISKANLNLESATTSTLPANVPTTRDSLSENRNSVFDGPLPGSNFPTQGQAIQLGNNPPPTLPDDLRQQLEAPPPELPDDLKAQLNSEPPELPEDIKKAMINPPRVVTIDEVNNPPE